MARDLDGPPLDEAALAISAALTPGLDEIEWLAALDLLAGECPTPTADGVARHLFGTLEFAGNRRAYYDWRNSCLDRVIATIDGLAAGYGEDRYRTSPLLRRRHWGGRALHG